MSRKIKNRLSIISRIARFCEFPDEISDKVPVIEIKGGYEAYVSGCRGIAEYTATCVVLETASFSIRISGDCLVLSDFTAGCVCVSGFISDVNFIGGENA